MSRIVVGFIAAIFLVWIPTCAAQSDRDFSGSWVLSKESSRPGDLPIDPEPSLEIEQDATTIRCSSKTARWAYALNGSETKTTIGSETRSSAVKWEGAALLINTLVSGPRPYVIMDRWRLSAGRASLTITRQIMVGSRQTEGVLIYRPPGQPAVERSAREIPRASPLPQSIPAAEEPAVVENRRAASLPPARAAENIPESVTVLAGTRILLSMLNTVDTKHSHEGDRVYLHTAVPVSVDGRVVIPRGSAVTAVITSSKQPGRVKGKGELFIRFDSLTLPNGVTRDFRSRLTSADASTRGDVDRKEGKITSPSDKGGDARTIGTGTTVGASAGGLAGAIGGNSRMGTGVGAAAGAAAGLGRVLIKRGPDASIPRGTNVEMVLDRDLQFQAEELRF